MAVVKLQLAAGQATPAPPVGTALGPHGINIGSFCKQYNDATKDKAGMVVPVILTIFADRSFSFVLKTPPASVMLKKAAGLAKGANNPGTETVGSVTRAQCLEIAKTKVEDLQSASDEAAINIIAGTARSMGITVED